MQESPDVEDKDERPLSPVLSYNKIDRKKIKRRSGGVRTKVTFQNDSQSAKDRFDKICKLESESKVLADQLYEIQNRERKSSDSFKFKKPGPPASKGRILCNTPVSTQDSRLQESKTNADEDTPHNISLFPQNGISDTQMNTAMDNIISSEYIPFQEDSVNAKPVVINSNSEEVLSVRSLEIKKHSNENFYGFEKSEQVQSVDFKQFHLDKQKERRNLELLLNFPSICVGFPVPDKRPLESYSNLIDDLEKYINDKVGGAVRVSNNNLVEEKGVNSNITIEADDFKCIHANMTKKEDTKILHDHFMKEEFDRDYDMFPKISDSEQNNTSNRSCPNDKELTENDNKINKDGFSTADRKIITPSETTLIKNDFFNEEDLALTDTLEYKKSKSNVPIETKVFIDTSEQKLIADIFTKEEFDLNDNASTKEKLKKSTGTINQVNFITASRKNIPLSQKALQNKFFTEEDFVFTDSLDFKKSVKSVPTKINAFDENFIENIFTGEDFGLNDDLDYVSNNAQFTSNSGKNTSLSRETLNKSLCTEKDLALTDLNFKKLDAPKEIANGSCTKHGIAKGLSNEEEILTSNVSVQQPIFSTASGKNITLSQKSLQATFFSKQDMVLTDSLEFKKTGKDMSSTSEAVFEDKSDQNLIENIFIKEDFGLNESFNSKPETIQLSSQSQFATASGKNISLSQKVLKNSFFTQEDLALTDSLNFRKADHGKSPEDKTTIRNISEAPLENIRICKDSTNLNKIKQTLASKHHEISRGAENVKFNKENFSTPKAKNFISPLLKAQTSTPNLKRPSSEEDNSTPKRKLGCSPHTVKNIDVSTKHMQRAKSLFAEEDLRCQSLNNNPLSTMIVNEQMRLEKLQRIHKNKVQIEESNSSNMGQTPNADTLAIIPRLVNNRQLQQDFVETISELEEKLDTLRSRQMLLDEQLNLIKNGDADHRRRREGVLYQKKRNGNRINLKELKDLVKPEALSNSMGQFLAGISPINAQCLHFIYNRISRLTAMENHCTTTTCDGAIVIPNPTNFIGLPEVENAFLSMPGIDPLLLHKDWVSNHFKWIVWKLASTERQYPNVFADCLSVENIIQQLKYRYDREIDRVHRSALRKITEKDDVPQKRMTLCVAEIFKINDLNYELLLTDGWYAIRTIIDQQLSKQIHKKIVLGTKLIIQGAELLNCDGGHPLDLTDMVRLKINYNCTRRTVWYAKLGYQKLAEPFPISLNSIHPDGGAIGCIKVCIARIYPLKYREQQVWRNKKAEDKRAAEYEREQFKQMSSPRVQNVFENCPKTAKIRKIDLNNIPNIQSPEILCKLLEDSNDPDAIQELLSPEQLSSLMNFKNSNRNRNRAMQARDVVAVLRLLLLDVTGKEKTVTMNIWRPGDDILETLKEGCVYFIYNVMPKFNGELVCTTRTRFKEEKSFNVEQKYKRSYTSISCIAHSPETITFSECDTVGTVIRFFIQNEYQEIWLADANGSLLCVQFFEGPNRCFIDNLIPGDIVALSNLIVKPVTQNVAKATGSIFTVVSSYPKYTFLQEAIIDHKSNLPQDLSEFLKDCKDRVTECGSKLHNIHSLKQDDSCADKTTLSNATLEDIAIAMMDSDEW